RTISIFGILRLAAEQFEQLPSLHCEKPEVKQKIVVEDPFSPERKAKYWQERLHLKEVYGGEATLPAMVALRTNTLIYELKDIAAHTPDDEQHEDLRIAYEIVAHWCEEQMQPFTEASAKQPEKFGFLVRRLHFGQGNPEDMIAILNAAEVIKQKNPELFIRMAGIAPGYDHGTRGDFELRESDVLGSVFNLGLHRSLELIIRSNSTANVLFHNRIQALTELNRPQPLLQHLSEDQITQIEEKYKSMQLNTQEGNPLERTVSTIFAIMQARMMYALFEARLPQMLEAIKSQEWDEQREFIVERLRVAGPTEFLQYISELPTEFSHDREITEIIQKRIFDVAPKRPAYQDNSRMVSDIIPYVVARDEGGENYESEIQSPFDLIQSVKGYSSEMERHGTWAQVERLLWKTAGNEAVLSEEFYDLLHTVFMPALAKGQTINQKQWELVCDILYNHESISVDQWMQWKQSIEQTDKGIRVVFKKDRSMLHQLIFFVLQKMKAEQRPIPESLLQYYQSLQINND
ncbi:MAG TPA: hypothetical protein VJB65_03070, partial [Patescibacteria group bacterium]|nr:hypothetical protein [Patescibacteria group bacterium]